LSAVYAAGKVMDVYAAIEAGDVRELVDTILNQFEDGEGVELASQIRGALITIDHTVSAVIRFRTRKGYFSSVEFLLPLLGEEKMCDLIEEAAKHK
jgi:hypothetical protein